MTMQDFLRLSWFLCCVVLSSKQPADAQQTALAKLLQANRYQLTVEDGEMSGPGAPFLKKELSEAQFVAIGEEHGTREVPQFVWATCRAMAQNSLDAMAIESGPLVTAQLQQWTAKNGGSTGLAQQHRNQGINAYAIHCNSLSVQAQQQGRPERRPAGYGAGG